MYGKGSSKFLIYLGLRNQPVVFNLDHKGKGIEFKFKPIFSQREPTLATRHDYVRLHRGT